MRILYGVAGQGSGHAIRSREVLRYLKRHGHELHVLASGRATPVLAPEFATTEVAGLTLTYERNAIQYLPTIWKNALRTPAVAKSLRKAAHFVREWQPDLIITDFEPLAALLGIRFQLPTISIDNIHHSVFRTRGIPWRYRPDWLMSRALVRLIVPYADEYIVTCLDSGSPERRVHFVPPIVREELFRVTPTTKQHILVYDSFADMTLPSVLEGMPGEFRVYGHGRSEHAGSVTFCRWDEERFLHDLATCRAVIATGGFTLISEALVLKKPYLVLPAARHFEQIDNALALEDLGYGRMAEQVDQLVIERFLTEVPTLQRNLEGYRHPGNRAFFDTLDAAIARNVPVAAIASQT